MHPKTNMQGRDNSGVLDAPAPPVRQGGASQPLRVMLFDHTAQLGGGEIALYDLVRFFNRTLVTPIVVLAAEGPLADKLRQLGNVQVIVLPISSSVLKSKKDSLGVGTLMQLGNVLRSCAYILKLAGLIRRYKVHLVHTNSLKSDILGGIAGRIAGRRVIWHIRDRIEKDYLPAKVVALMRKLARILPVYVIANSTATLATVHLDSKIPGRAIASGVDMTKFETGATSATSAQTNHPLIGIVGRLCPWKGQHIFLQAAAILHRSWPAVRFQIIGAALFEEQFYVDELKALTAELDLTDVVEFTGFRSDVNMLIQQLTVLVHASTTGEPFGQVIVQGMAASKPVVATNGGGVPEIVVDGVTGYLVPMGDAAAMASSINTLLAAPEEAAEMGRKGRERILQKFTIESSARAVEEVYAAVADPKKS